MKARMLCLLLLSACTEVVVPFDYALTWTCQSPEGCERTEELLLIDRLDVSGEVLFFHSTQDMSFHTSAETVASDELPDGCSWLYGFSILGYELDPSRLCETAGGLALELSIPNGIGTTHSDWLVEARALKR